MRKVYNTRQKKKVFDKVKELSSEITLSGDQNPRIEDGSINPEQPIGLHGYVIYHFGKQFPKNPEKADRILPGYYSNYERYNAIDADVIDIIVKLINENFDPHFSIQEDEAPQKVLKRRRKKRIEGDTAENQSKAPKAASLSNSLHAFSSACDRILLFPEFSLQVLSLHLAFAAFYTFLALALTWAVSGISDIGDVPILPTNTEAASEREFDVDAVVENRLFVLSVVLIVVLVFAVGFLTALTSKGSFSRLLDYDLVIAASAAAFSGVALWISGMHEAFVAVFTIMIAVSIGLAGRLTRRQLIYSAYPIAFIINISLIVLIGLFFGSIEAAGGLLPILSLLALLIGVAANGRIGGLIAAFVVAVNCLIFAALNIFIFESSWFRIDPWDPGTVVLLLLLPIANGFWDWVSTSTTRKLTANALNATKSSDRQTAIFIYTKYVFIDVIVAFATIVFLYLSLVYLLELYNYIAFSSSDRRVSLDAYFQGFEEGFLTERALLVIIMLLTVLLPTILHVHVVSRAMIPSGGQEAILATLAYAVIMVFSVLFLLNTARGMLRFILPEA